ncbi:uncharacterized protein [Miscanthus floridulus]|uniref:uncharacterized protein n=1 Tax=Miscanthus floridulus TaxID=154761 RepID=UPI0034585EFD
MRKTVRQREGWKKPPTGKLLTNVDGSFREQCGDGGTGVVIRDSDGSIIAGSYTYREHVVDAPMAEAMALKEGLLLAQHIGCNGFIVHSDCMEVMDTMKSGISSTVGAPIFDECFQLWQNFEAISLEKCDREANKVAHELAKVALSAKEICIWVDEPPDFIVESLVNDVILFDNQ